MNGREGWLSSIAAGLDDALTVHYVHAPATQFANANTAHRRWAGRDVSDGRATRFSGAPHYVGHYVRGGDGRWGISSVRLIRRQLAPVRLGASARASALDRMRHGQAPRRRSRSISPRPR